MASSLSSSSTSIPPSPVKNTPPNVTNETEKRRSDRSEKRRERLSVRSSLSNTQRSTYSTSSTSANSSPSSSVSPSDRTRRGLSLQQMEEGVGQKTSGGGQQDDRQERLSDISLPGAFRITSMIQEPDITDCIIEESSTGSMSGSDSPKEVIIPSAQLVIDDKVSRDVDEAVPIAYAQNGMFVNKRMVCVVLFVFVVLVAALSLALMDRGGRSDDSSLDPVDSSSEELANAFIPTVAPTNMMSDSDGQVDNESSTEKPLGTPAPSALVNNGRPTTPPTLAPSTAGDSPPNEPTTPSSVEFVETTSPTDAPTVAPSTVEPNGNGNGNNVCAPLDDETSCSSTDGCSWCVDKSSCRSSTKGCNGGGGNGNNGRL